ncbi:acyl-CoA desaturase, partial [Glutamicibacter sp. NPDC087661]
MPRSSLLDVPAPTVKPGDPQSFFHVKKLVTEAGLVGRRRGHYLGLGIVLTVLLAGTVTGFIL